MLKTILIIVVLAIAVILFLAARKPDNFHVERSATIHAPPEKIQGMLSDFHQWSEWSPWEKLDPAMTRTFGGTPSGPNSTYAWTGNSKVGEGRMEILSSSPSKVAIKLDFLKPFEAHNTATFALAGSGDNTSVVWSMDGPTPFVSKVMQVFMNMDAMIGKDFEKGLANLKAAAE